MERVQGAATPYEVYCHACRVTFPIGTRRCIHCGGPLSDTRHPGAPALRPADPVAHGVPGPPPILDPEEGEEELQGGSLMLRRFGGLALWALIALLAMISNLCSGRE